jgi:hypothetical protein
MTIFLTADELIELTGYKLSRCQVRWLIKNGVKHWVPATGRPVVPRSAIDGASPVNEDSQPFEPNYAA